MLEVRDLHVSYGMIDAVKGIDFKVNDSQIVALIGANGAGKTTTMHALSGLLKVKQGEILLDGVDLVKINRHSPYLSITLHKCYPYYLFGISTFPNSAYHSIALRKFSITIV